MQEQKGDPGAGSHSRREIQEELAEALTWPVDPEELANPPAPAPDPVRTGRHSVACSRAWRLATWSSALKDS
jgi:hypothetical protein